MPFLSRRSRDELDLVDGRDIVARRPIPPSIRAATEKGVAIEHGRTLVQAARIRGIERVASEGIQAVGGLSREEAFWTQHAPHAGPRFQAIADIAAMAIADIVADAGRN